MSPAAFNLRHLRVLAAVVRHGGFGAAARAVGVTQPAASQAVARLEATSGVRLIERGPRKVAPTDAGILLGARAEAAAAALAQAFGPQRKGGIGKPGADAELTMAQLTALDALAAAGSYAAGKAALGLSQPSLRRSVAELERLCGVPLVERRGRGVALTDEGERLARGFRLALAELQAGLDELAVLAGRDQGAIRVGVHASALHRLLPAAVARFKAEHPPVLIEVQEPDLQRLQGGHLDAVIGLGGAPLPAGLTAAPLSDDPLVIAARTGHPLAGGSAPGLVRLAGFGWALPPAGSGERDAWERLFLDGGVFPPAPGVTCASISFLLGLTAQSELLTVASAALIEQRSGTLTALGAPLPADRRFQLVTRTGWAPTPAQATFLDELRAAAATVLSF